MTLGLVEDLLVAQGSQTTPGRAQGTPVHHAEWSLSYLLPDPPPGPALGARLLLPAQCHHAPVAQQGGAHVPQQTGHQGQLGQGQAVQEAGHVAEHLVGQPAQRVPVSCSRRVLREGGAQAEAAHVLAEESARLYVL